MFIFFFSFHFFQPLIIGEIQSPMGVADVEFIDPREPVAVAILLFSTKVCFIKPF